MRFPLSALAVIAALSSSLPGQSAVRKSTAAPARDVSCDATGATRAVANVSPVIVPIDVYNNHVYVHVCAGGRDLDFVLDTGAPLTMIDLSLAKRLSLTLGGPFRVGGIGAGASAGAAIEGAELTIAGTAQSQPLEYAVDLSHMPSRYVHVLDGILGYDFIARNIIAIDFDKQELRIYDRGRFTYRGHGVTVPLAIDDRTPYADGSIRLLDGETVRGRFQIDLGSSAALSLTKPFVEAHRLRDRVGATVHPPGFGGLGGIATLVTGRVTTLSLGRADVPNVEVHLFGDSAGLFSGNDKFVGNVGGDVLRRFVVYFDYQSKVMILEPK